MSEWISVKDRKPRRKGFYLVVHEECREVMIDEFATWLYDDGRHRGFYTDGDIKGYVTHWMPLPEPPK